MKGSIFQDTTTDEWSMEGLKSYFEGIHKR